MEKIIELKNLTKNFDDQQVLKGINLDIHHNEFLTLLGPSGCGKTTTLRIIAGFEEASSGEVLFDGMDISKIPAYKREINTVFQKYALFPHMNVFDNVAFGLNIKKMEGCDQDQGRADAVHGRPGELWFQGRYFIVRRSAAACCYCQSPGE